MNWDQCAKEVENFQSIAPERLVDISYGIGEKLSKPLKMNQIRRFLDALRKIEQNYYQMDSEKDPSKREQYKERIKHKLTMLRPKLAYAVGRAEKEQKEILKSLMKVLEPAIKSAAANPEKAFEKLLRFMESIIAYHRFYGGGN